MLDRVQVQTYTGCDRQKTNKEIDTRDRMCKMLTIVKWITHCNKEKNKDIRIDRQVQNGTKHNGDVVLD